MLAEKTEIWQMIPQKPPMAMVDGLVAHDEVSTISRLELNDQNIFCKNGYFHETGLIENIAQTAALRAGYTAQMNNSQPLVGYIGAIKKMKIYHLPEDTDVLETKITVLTEVANATIVKGEVYSNFKMMAEGELSIFKQDL
ncbi:MAG: 3-hydroxyacyl-ACP dehydratase [Bacteroidetes bacterium]|nr:3-hydroxyacyl-ACP dehydratase [Bacteroidota bacterium]